MKTIMNRIKVPRYEALFIGSEHLTNRRVFASKIAAARWLAWKVYFSYFEDEHGCTNNAPDMKAISGKEKAAVLKEINNIAISEVGYSALVYLPNLQCPHCGWIGFWCECAQTKCDGTDDDPFGVEIYWECPACGGVMCYEDYRRCKKPKIDFWKGKEQ